MGEGAVLAAGWEHPTLNNNCWRCMEKFANHEPNKFGFRCEVKKMTCNYCKKKGHIEVACKKKKDTELAISGWVTVEDVVVRRILSKK